jgi:hypothetical protein
VEFVLQSREVVRVRWPATKEHPWCWRIVRQSNTNWQLGVTTDGRVTGSSRYDSLNGAPVRVARTMPLFPRQIGQNIARGKGYCEIRSVNCRKNADLDDYSTEALRLRGEAALECGGTMISEFAAKPCVNGGYPRKFDIPGTV